MSDSKLEDMRAIFARATGIGNARPTLRVVSVEEESEDVARLAPFMTDAELADLQARRQSPKPPPDAA